MLRIALLLLLATPAYAGLDCNEDEAIADLEAFAKTKAGAKINDPNNYNWLCVEGVSPKLKPRIEKACLKILDRDGEKNNECITVAAASGITMLGKHDIFTLVGKFEEDPIEFAGGVGWTKTALYERMADPRAQPIVMEMWTTAIPRAEAREKRHRQMVDWSSWRQHAAAVLGAVGDGDAKTFLDEQAQATKDTAVRHACTEAAAKIAKRLETK